MKSKQSTIILSLCLILTIVQSACNSSNSSIPENSQSLPAEAQSTAQALPAATIQPDNPSAQLSKEQFISPAQESTVSSPNLPSATSVSPSPTPSQAPEQPTQSPTASPDNTTPLVSAGQVNDSQPAAKASGASEKPAVGFAAPEFSLTTLDGKTISLTDLRGRDVVINYWVTWCIPCQEELPVLDKLGQEYGAKGVTVLSIDGIQQDTLGDVQSAVSKLGLTHPVLLDDGNSFSKAYWVKFMPTSIFIDKQGIIRFIQLGSTTEENFRTKIEDLLSSQS